MAEHAEGVVLGEDEEGCPGGDGLHLVDGARVLDHSLLPHRLLEHALVVLLLVGDVLLLEVGVVREVLVHLELGVVHGRDGGDQHPVRADDHVLFPRRKTCGLLLLAALLLLVLARGEIVHGDSQEHVEEDEVTRDKEKEEVDQSHGAEPLDASVGLDTVVHHHVPILTGQNLGNMVWLMVIYGYVFCV